MGWRWLCSCMMDSLFLPKCLLVSRALWLKLSLISKGRQQHPRAYGGFHFHPFFSVWFCTKHYEQSAGKGGWRFCSANWIFVAFDTGTSVLCWKMGSKWWYYLFSFENFHFFLYCCPELHLPSNFCSNQAWSEKYAWNGSLPYQKFVIATNPNPFCKPIV